MDWFTFRQIKNNLTQGLLPLLLWHLIVHVLRNNQLYNNNNNNNDRWDRMRWEMSDVSILTIVVDKLGHFNYTEIYFWRYYSFADD